MIQIRDCKEYLRQYVKGIPQRIKQNQMLYLNKQSDKRLIARILTTLFIGSVYRVTIW